MPHDTEWMRNWKKPIIEHMKMTPWYWVVNHPQNLTIEDYVDIGAFTYIDCTLPVHLGPEVQIGSHCSIYTHNTIDNTTGPVRIQWAACIGSHSTIMPGVLIGHKVIVGAHSLVKDNIPAYEVWAGVPAKRLKLQ